MQTTLDNTKTCRRDEIKVGEYFRSENSSDIKQAIEWKGGESIRDGYYCQVWIKDGDVTYMNGSDRVVPVEVCNEPVAFRDRY